MLWPGSANPAFSSSSVICMLNNEPWFPFCYYCGVDLKFLPYIASVLRVLLQLVAVLKGVESRGSLTYSTGKSIDKFVVGGLLGGGPG